MLKLRCNYNVGKSLNFAYGYSHFLFYSTCSSTSGNGKANSSFANYLVEYLGFSKQLAGSTSTKLMQLRQARGAKKVSSFKFAANADSVVEFLKQNGLNESQIRIAVSSLPQILLSSVDKTLKPKVDIFLKFGFSKSDFAQVVSVNPTVFVDRTFISAIEALKAILNCEVIYVMKKSNWRTISGMSNNLIPNVALLRNYEIPVKLIRDRLLLQPASLLRKTSTFKGLLIRVEKKLGIPRDSSMFLHGIHLLGSLSEKNIESKIKMFKSFGWKRSDVVALIRRNPVCLVLSEARIKRSLEFLMKELDYDPAYLISHYPLICYSLEKRIVPRLLEALKEKSLIRKDYALYSTLSYNESRFLEKNVLPFEEIHEVYAKHTGISPVRSLTEGTAGGEL